MGSLQTSSPTEDAGANGITSMSAYPSFSIVDTANGMSATILRLTVKLKNCAFSDPAQGPSSLRRIHR